MTTVLFDLDGTLIDSAPGIVASTHHALAALARPAVSDEAVRKLIGVPLWGMFEHLGVPAEQINEAVQAYRERYGTLGLYEAEVYAGIPEFLGRLNDAGHTLAVATSKYEPFAEKALEHFGLLERFATVSGANHDGSRRHKIEVIREALRRLAVDAAGVTMVGDRAEDLAGAAEAGCAAVAVTWGYGTREDFAPFPVRAVANDTEELEVALGLDRELPGGLS